MLIKLKTLISDYFVLIEQDQFPNSNQGHVGEEFKNTRIFFL